MARLPAHLEQDAQKIVVLKQTVQLAVEDADYDSASASLVVQVVADELPSFTFTTNATLILVGQSVAFTFSGSAGNTPFQATWSFGDGSFFNMTSGPSTSHVYSVAGNFSITLTVTDWDGDVFTYTSPATVLALNAGDDYDADGLTNGQEMLEVGSDPLDADTDGDGTGDGDEVRLGLDPTTPGDAPMFIGSIVTLCIVGGGIAFLFFLDYKKVISLKDIFKKKRDLPGSGKLGKQ